MQETVNWQLSTADERNTHVENCNIKPCPDCRVIYEVRDAIAFDNEAIL